MKIHLDALGLAFASWGLMMMGILVATAIFIALIPAIDPTAPQLVLTLIAGGTATLGLLFGSAYVGTAIGLATRAPWSRVAGIVLGVSAAQSFPLGTILGAWSLVTLMSDDAAAELA